MRPLDRVIGHRGAAAQAPENTLAGFRRAHALGLRRVEFDARLTLDGVPVIIHDPTLVRTTGAAGSVFETSVDELKTLDAGAWFGPEFAGERIPTLDEGLRLLAELGLAADLEVKSSGTDPAREAEAMIAVLRSLPPDAVREIVVSSFEPAILEAFRDRAPDIPRALAVERLDGDWRDRLTALDSLEVHANHEYLDGRAVRGAVAAGTVVLAYTVNDPDRAETLFSWGIEAIFSDAPPALIQALGG